MHNQEGIVLRTMEYKERERILHLYTPHSGLISLIVKRLSRKQGHLLALSTPFCHGDYHYTIGRSSLYRFTDGSVIQTHCHLRDDLSYLETAGAIAHALLVSQLPGKPAPALFQLALTYLKQIPLAQNQQALKASFLLKLLKHEGLLSTWPHCSQCERPIAFLEGGEGFCALHGRGGAPLSDEEWQTLQALAEARSFQKLSEISLAEKLEKKIAVCFEQAVSKN